MICRPNISKPHPAAGDRRTRGKAQIAAAELRAREAELILAALPAGARLVALDEARRRVVEAANSPTAGGVARSGPPVLAFAIGGADGLGAAVIERAEAVVSFGAMTWPHFLARGMLLEQLYRAQQILAGHPYHRD